VWIGQELNPAVYRPSVCAQFAAAARRDKHDASVSCGAVIQSRGSYYGNLDIIDVDECDVFNACLFLDTKT